jgi:hypothetical protein
MQYSLNATLSAVRAKLGLKNIETPSALQQHTPDAPRSPAQPSLCAPVIRGPTVRDAPVHAAAGDDDPWGACSPLPSVFEPPPVHAFPSLSRAASLDSGGSLCNTEVSAGSSEGGRSWGAPAGRSSLGGVSPVGGSVAVYGMRSAELNAGLGGGDDLFSPPRPSQLARADARPAPPPPLPAAPPSDAASDVSSAAGLSEIAYGGARMARESKRLSQFGRLVAAGAAAAAAAVATASPPPAGRAASPLRGDVAGPDGFSPASLRRRRLLQGGGENEEAAAAASASALAAAPAPAAASPQPAPRRRASDTATHSLGGATSVSACGSSGAWAPAPAEPPPPHALSPLQPPSPLFGVRGGPRVAEPYRPSLALNEDAFDYALIVRAPLPASPRGGASGARPVSGSCDSEGVSGVAAVASAGDAAAAEAVSPRPRAPACAGDDYDDEAEDDFADAATRASGGGGDCVGSAAPPPHRGSAPARPCAAILAALRAAGLDAIRVRSLSRRTWLIKVRAPEWRLELEAEKLRLRLRRHDGGWSKYRRALRGAFAAHAGCVLFHSSDRQGLIDHIVRCPALEGGAALERGSPLGDLVVHAFPLHMLARLEELRSDLLAPWRPLRSDAEGDRVGPLRNEWYAPARLVDVEEGGGDGVGGCNGGSGAPPPPPPPPPPPRCCRAPEPPVKDLALNCCFTRACQRCLRASPPVRALYTAGLLLLRLLRSLRRLALGAFSMPLDRIAAYFGETIAFYFAFMEAYTAWLLAPAACGALLFVGQLWYGAVLTAYSPLYALCSALWSLAFLEAWRRRSVELAQRWGTLGGEGEETLRPGFAGAWKRDAATGELLRVYPPWRRALTYAFTVPLTLAIACALLCGLVLVFSARDHALAALSRAAGVDALRGAVARAPAVAAAVSAGTLPPPPPAADVDMGASLSEAWRAGLLGFLSSPPREWTPQGEVSPALLSALAAAADEGGGLPGAAATSAFAPAAASLNGDALHLERVSAFFSKRGDVRWWLAMTAPPAALALLLPAVEAAFGWLAVRLVAAENHAFESSARNSRIAKVFAVRFVGAFASLFWYAFSPSASPTQLAVQLAAYLLVGQAFGATLRLLLPACTGACGARAHTARLRAAEDSGLTEGRRGARLLRHANADAWRQARLPPHDPFDDYCAVVMQWGHLTFFPWAFPLAPAVALVFNLINGRLAALRLTRLLQRPLAQKAGGIGVWFSVLRAMALSAVLANTAFLVLTPATLDAYLPVSLAPQQRVLAVFLAEHAVLAAQLLLPLACGAMHARVARRMARDDFSLMKVQVSLGVGAAAGSEARLQV